MAQKTQVILVDDVDGSEANQTVTFALDGVSYEIDLNDEHAAALRESLEEWVGKARRTGGRRSSGRRRSSGPSDTQKIREWAREQGLEVADRGRVSAEVRKAYDDGNPGNGGNVGVRLTGSRRPASSHSRADCHLAPRLWLCAQAHYRGRCVFNT